MLHNVKSGSVWGGVIVLVLMIGGCIPSAPSPLSEESATPVLVQAQPVTLRTNFGDDPPSADPAFSIDGLSMIMVASLFTSLTDINPDTQDVVPMLAERWESNATQDEWTFYLRQDVPWVRHDPATGATSAVVDDSGNPRMVTAHDVVYGVLRVLDPRTAAAYPNILYMVQGALELNSADPTAADFADLIAAVGVEAVDDWTVRFTLRGPAGYWPQVMGAAAIPQPQWAIEAAGDTWTEPETIITNGAYVLNRWVHGDQIVLDKNPLWPLWGEEYADGNVERVDILIMADSATAFALYEDDELDFVGIPLSQIESVRANPEYSDQLLVAPVNCTDALIFQTQKFPTDDVRVRRALSMAVDRQTLIEDVLKSLSIPANTATNPLNFGSAALDPEIAAWALTEAQGGLGYEAAIALGKQELDAAGYPDGAGLEIDFATIALGAYMLEAQAIQSMWQRSYPELKVNLVTVDPGSYMQMISDPSLPVEETVHVFPSSWCADYPHAHNWLYDGFSPIGGLNNGRLSVDDAQVGQLLVTFDQLLQDALVAPTDEAAQIYREAEKLLVEEIVALAPLSYPTILAVHKPWVEEHYDPMRARFHQWRVDPVAQMAAR